MDRELDEQIDELITKATNELKTRISRVCKRHSVITRITPDTRTFFHHRCGRTCIIC